MKDAAYLDAHPNIKVVVGGYCDERGSTEYNLALGENRASSVKKTLIAGGVSADRIRTVSYGKEKQFCTEHDEKLLAAKPPRSVFDRTANTNEPGDHP